MKEKEEDEEPNEWEISINFDKSEDRLIPGSPHPVSNKDLELDENHDEDNWDNDLADPDEENE